jgi:hypothetical protein
MPELSPAARAVLDAAENDCIHPADLHKIVAATLEAAADQAVPEPDDWDKDNFSIQALRLRCVVRDQLLAIAAELKAHD